MAVTVTDPAVPAVTGFANPATVKLWVGPGFTLMEVVPETEPNVAVTVCDCPAEWAVKVGPFQDPPPPLQDAEVLASHVLP